MPYLGGANPNFSSVADAQAAQPGPSFNPSGGSPFGAGSLLNLSSILPALAQAQQSLANASVPSGQATALPSTNTAVPGITSVDLNNAVNQLNAPAAGGPLQTATQPVGAGPTAAPAAPVAAGPVPSAAGGDGAPASSDATGVASSGVGDGGGGGAGGGAGGTILCGWTVSRVELAPREARIMLSWWKRTKEYLLDQPRGESDYRAYTETATQVTERLDATAPELRQQALMWFKRLLVDPVLRDHSWDPVRAESGLTVLSSLAAVLAQAFGIETPKHDQVLVGLRELEWVASVGADVRELTGAKQTAVAE